jgi:methionine-rich copper-binding protein CopC
MTLRILSCALACVAAPVSAHAFLDHANPGAGAVLHAAPRTLMLVFSDDLDAGSSGVTVVDASGRSVATGRTVVAGDRIVAPLPPLRPGKYRVQWHAMSDDDHRTQGAYEFMIKP